MKTDYYAGNWKRWMFRADGRRFFKKQHHRAVRRKNKTIIKEELDNMQFDPIVLVDLHNAIIATDQRQFWEQENGTVIAIANRANLTQFQLDELEYAEEQMDFSIFCAVKSIRHSKEYGDEAQRLADSYMHQFQYWYSQFLKHCDDDWDKYLPLI